MASKLSIKHMSSRKTRTHIRELLREHNADTEFSVNELNKIMVGGKPKRVTLKNWDYGMKKTRKVKQEIESLGLDVVFEK